MLTKTEKKTTQRTVERNYSLFHYKQARVVLAKVVTIDTEVSRGEPETEWYLFSEKIYNKYQNRKIWTWIIQLDHDNLLSIVSVEFMKYYMQGISYIHPDQKSRYIAESGWKKLLDSGDYGRIARDMTVYDGMMYDQHDSPILRAFRLNYVSAQLGSADYYLPHLEEWLKNQKGVSDVEIIDIPYYNQDSCGEQSIEFTFLPTKQIFLLMVRDGLLASFQSGEFITKRLKVNKFRKRDNGDD